MKRIAVFASGEGTNAQRLMEVFQADKEVSISLIITNKPNAGVIKRGERMGVPVKVLPRASFDDGTLLAILKEAQIDFIVLAGFLLKISPELVQAYPQRIVNIHPSLLPKYGGKGMYGGYVHAAVIAAGEKESGITIHYVNEAYDEGAYIFQASCEVLSTDTPETLAARIHTLEYEHFPAVVDLLVKALPE